MEARELAKYQRGLHSRMPLIGGWLRRGAARRLAEEGSAGAVRALADAVARTPDARLREQALTALRQVEQQACVDACCGIWLMTRHADLERLLIEKRWVATGQPAYRVYSALKTGQPERVIQGNAAGVLPLVQACEDRDAEIAARAREWLPQLKREEAREAVCRVVIEEDNAPAREGALAGGYLPKDPHQRALFLFLTEQWERYEGHDFDHRLLRTAYEAADARLRGRLMEKLRAAGRP